MLTRSLYKKQKNNLIHATKITNWVINDPLIDYLELIDINKLKLDENLKITKKRSISLDNDIQESPKKISKSSFDYILQSGIMFESNIIMEIEQMMKNNNEYKKMIKINEKNIDLNYSETTNTIINDKHTIILGSVLINEKNNTWGKPDLIVKGEWINKYIETKIPSVNLNKWYIIDIKSSTINLISGGDDVSSKSLYNSYKTQIYVYTDALNETLKKYNKINNVEKGFILGKKYKYVVNKNTIVKKPFEYLGIIDFRKNISGNTYSETISRATNWNMELKENWMDYKLNPINKDELYPNMKNKYDKNWHNIKKSIGLANKEITLLWNCGIANRNLAWNHGIKNYDDPRLNANILGFEGKSKEKIINLMLDLTRSDKNYILNKQNNHMEWQNKNNLEFFVDFETYNTDMIWDEQNDWDDSFTSEQKIYMIGVSYVLENNLIHKTFLIKYPNYLGLCKKFSEKFNDIPNINLDSNNNWDRKYDFNDCIICSDELDLMQQFYKFIMSFVPENILVVPESKFNFIKNNIRLCHWSCAEPIIFNKKIKEYNLDKNEYDFDWYDLLKIFKYEEYPIIFKECFSFGLKEIIKKMNKYELINLSWSDLDDGLLSSFIARDIYVGNNLDMQNDQNDQINTTMYDIIEYNYIDCKALYLLLNWMRKTVAHE